MSNTIQHPVLRYVHRRCSQLWGENFQNLGRMFTIVGRIQQDFHKHGENSTAHCSAGKPIQSNAKYSENDLSTAVRQSPKLNKSRAINVGPFILPRAPSSMRSEFRRSKGINQDRIKVAGQFDRILAVSCALAASFRKTSFFCSRAHSNRPPRARGRLVYPAAIVSARRRCSQFRKRFTGPR